MKTARKLDPANRDPNYLLESQFSSSPWHQALKSFKERCNKLNVPMLHVDFHGKKDTIDPSKQANWTVDLGIAPLVECCADSYKVWGIA